EDRVAGDDGPLRLQLDGLADLLLGARGDGGGHGALVERALRGRGRQEERGQVGRLLGGRVVQGRQLDRAELVGPEQVVGQGRGEQRLLLRGLFLRVRDQADDAHGVCQGRVATARGDLVLQREQ